MAQLNFQSDISYLTLSDVSDLSYLLLNLFGGDA